MSCKGEGMLARGQLKESQFLRAIDELLNHYHRFPWESQIWAAHGARRSPYRVLILFGLSSRTKDHLLVENLPQPLPAVPQFWSAA